MPLLLPLLIGLSLAADSPQDALRIPRIAGEWITIARDPDPGALTRPEQQPVDFGIWRAADGAWQLWSCIRKTGEPGHTRLFFGWESPELTRPGWTPRGIVMQADPALGESGGGLQAPFVVRDRNLFRLFYGDWVRICSAESRDGRTFTRRLVTDGQPALFQEAADANARDPMILRSGDLWYAYYTAHPGRKGAVYARTSSDLVHWSSANLVAAGGQAGDGPSSAECPHVVEWSPGHFYLFRTQKYGQEAVTRVYHSTDPLDFGTGSNGDALHLVTSLPVAAPELIRVEQDWFIAALRPDLKGIQIAPLRWDVLPPKAPRAADGKIRAALYVGPGSAGRGIPRTRELLSALPGIELRELSPAALRSGGLKDCDLVIFTGGTGSGQANAIGLAGRQAVRRFVQEGGGYLGICAGHYLACDGYSWSLSLLDAKTKSSAWKRGTGNVQVESTALGREILGFAGGRLEVRYANGPIFRPAARPDIADFEPLAFFRSEFAENGAPPGIMVDSPAIVAGHCGKGRVLCSSPHPEQTEGMEGFVERAVRWLAQSPGKP